MVEAGLVDEVRALAARPAGISRTARQALGYREILAHVEDGAPLDRLPGGGGAADPPVRPPPGSWFRRDPRISWAGERRRGRRPCSSEALAVHG